MSGLAAAQAAADALNELGVDPSQPVDPFDAIDRAGLLLSFKPMDTLLGVVIPGDPGGVLINSARPASLQRFTAAHELGHWCLHQEVLRLDTDATVAGEPRDSRELDAQTFAAHFLMPLELVHLTAHRYRLRRVQDAHPVDVYQAARDMHVSYEAAVRQLAICKVISMSNRNALLKARPAMIKSELADGNDIADARGDVWLIDEPRDARGVEVFVGDTLIVRLAEIPSTGYRWTPDTGEQIASVLQLRPAPAPFADGIAFLAERDRPLADVVALPRTIERSAVLTLLGEGAAHRRPEPGPVVVGDRTRRHVRYGATAPGREHIYLRHARPFAPEHALATVDVTAVVRAAPEAEHRRRFLETFAREEAELGEWRS